MHASTHIGATRHKETLCFRVMVLAFCSASTLKYDTGLLKAYARDASQIQSGGCLFINKTITRVPLALVFRYKRDHLL